MGQREAIEAMLLEISKVDHGPDRGKSLAHVAMRAKFLGPLAMDVLELSDFEARIIRRQDWRAVLAWGCARETDDAKARALGVAGPFLFKADLGEGSLDQQMSEFLALCAQAAAREAKQGSAIGLLALVGPFPKERSALYLPFALDAMREEGFIAPNLGKLLRWSGATPDQWGAAKDLARALDPSALWSVVAWERIGMGREPVEAGEDKAQAPPSCERALMVLEAAACSADPIGMARQAARGGWIGKEDLASLFAKADGGLSAFESALLEPWQSARKPYMASWGPKRRASEDLGAISRGWLHPFEAFWVAARELPATWDEPQPRSFARAGDFATLSIAEIAAAVGLWSEALALSERGYSISELAENCSWTAIGLDPRLSGGLLARGCEGSGSEALLRRSKPGRWEERLEFYESADGQEQLSAAFETLSKLRAHMGDILGFAANLHTHVEAQARGMNGACALSQFLASFYPRMEAMELEPSVGREVGKALAPRL